MGGPESDSDRDCVRAVGVGAAPDARVDELGAASDGVGAYAVAPGFLGQPVWENEASIRADSAPEWVMMFEHSSCTMR